MGSAKDIVGLLVLPLATTAQGSHEPGQSLPLNYQIKFNGHFERVVGTFELGETGELPLHSDNLVLLALVQLWLREPRPNGQVRFERRDLLDLLGWDSGGFSYERLDTAMRRLSEVSVRLDTPLHARDGRAYEAQAPLRLLDTYEIPSSRPAHCTVRWGSLLREAQRLEDFKDLDWELVRTLSNAFTVYLYRLLDRVALAGVQQWSVSWRTLALALGVKVGAYARAGRFRQMLQPHLDELLARGVLTSIHYERGGQFLLGLANYLRSSLRDVLGTLGVDDSLAAELVASREVVDVMGHCDCLLHGSPRVQRSHPVEYLAAAIRERYPLHYTSTSRESFRLLWERVSWSRRPQYHQAALHLCGAAEHPEDCDLDPGRWSQRLVSVIRFLVDHELDPSRMAGAHAPVPGTGSAPSGSAT